MTTRGLRTHNGLPFHLANGLKLKGVDSKDGQFTNQLGIAFGADQLQTLWQWLIATQNKVSSIAPALQYATLQSAINGAATNEIISPFILVQVLQAYVANAPLNLNTMAKFAAAIGNDPNFKTSTTNLLNSKMNKTGGHFTGTATTPTPADTSIPTQLINMEFMTALLNAALVNNQSPPSLPSITGSANVYSGAPVTLTFSSVPNLAGAISIASFSVSINGGAPSTLIALNNSATGTYNVTGAPGSSWTVTVTALDSAGKTSLVSSRTWTVSSIQINQPVITSPTAGSTAVSSTPTFTTGPFSTTAGSDTHISTTWRVYNASNVMVFESANDIAHLTSITLPSNALASSTPYRLDVTFNGLQFGSATSSVSFTTMLQQVTPLVSTAGYVILGTDLAITATCDLPGNSTSIASYDIQFTSVNGSGVINIPATNNTFSYTFASYSYNNDGSNVVFTLVAVGNTGERSLTATTSLPAYTEAKPTIVTPLEGAVVASVRPTFELSWTPVVPGNTAVIYSWQITGPNGVQLAFGNETINDPAVKTWTPDADLQLDTPYRVRVYVTGTKTSQVWSDDRNFHTPVINTYADNVAFSTRAYIFTSTYDFGAAFAVPGTYGKIAVGTPSADVSYGVLVGRAEIFPVYTNGGQEAPINLVATQAGTSNLHLGRTMAISQDGLTIAVATGDNVPNPSTTYGTTKLDFFRSTDAGVTYPNLGAAIAIGLDASYRSVHLNADGTRVAFGYYGFDGTNTLQYVTVRSLSSGSLAAGLFTVASSAVADPLIYSVEKFGKVVRLSSSGDTLMVGVEFKQTFSSTVLRHGVAIFKEVSGVWSQVAFLPVADTGLAPGLVIDNMWADMSGDSSKICIGVPNADRVEVWLSANPAASSPTWTKQQILVDTTGIVRTDSKFGTSVAISDNGLRIIVASPNGIYYFMTDYSASRVLTKLTVFEYKNSSNAGWVEHPYVYVPSRMNPGVVGSFYNNNAALIHDHFGLQLDFTADGRYAFASDAGVDYHGGTNSNEIYHWDLQGRIA